MHAISLFVCWWFANGTLLHAFCTFSFWTKSKPLNWNRRREKNMKGASELYWTKWSMLSGLTVYEQEKGREKGVRESPLYLFFFFSPPLFFLLWNVFVCSPFAVLTKQFDDWRHVFFMWDSVAVICRETAIFYPQLLFMGSKCQKLLQFPKWIW